VEGEIFPQLVKVILTFLYQRKSFFLCKMATNLNLFWRKPHFFYINFVWWLLKVSKANFKWLYDLKIRILRFTVWNSVQPERSSEQRVLKDKQMNNKAWVVNVLSREKRMIFLHFRSVWLFLLSTIIILQFKKYHIDFQVLECSKRL